MLVSLEFIGYYLSKAVIKLNQMTIMQDYLIVGHRLHSGNIKISAKNQLISHGHQRISSAPSKPMDSNKYIPSIS